MTKISPFKPHINSNKPYVGGSTREETGNNGQPLVKLSSNENMLGASPKALKAIRQNVHLLVPTHPESP